jgi:hypothetical protein
VEELELFWVCYITHKPVPAFWLCYSTLKLRGLFKKYRTLIFLA